MKQGMQRIDHASAAALKRGEALRVTYRDAFSHRLILEEPLPAMPTAWQGGAFRHMTRHPVDVYVEHSVAAAERMIAQLAKQHGNWTLERAALSTT